jgi:hypothetical protein
MMEGTSKGAMNGKIRVGRKTAGGYCCNEIKFKDYSIIS